MNEVRREVRMGRDELAQVGSADDRARGWLERHHRRAAHATVKSQLSDVLACAVYLYDDFLDVNQ